LRAKEKVEKYFLENGIERPEWLKVKNAKTLIIKTSGWNAGEHEVTVDDVARYFASDAQNILSGVRSLGKITGDWRNIDHLAYFCLDIFKVTAIKDLRRASRKYGLTPKF